MEVEPLSVLARSRHNTQSVIPYEAAKVTRPDDLEISRDEAGHRVRRVLWRTMHASVSRRKVQMER